MAIEAFQSEVAKVLKAVLRIEDVTDGRFGYPEQAIANAEKRLGFSMPPSLRFIYAHLGQHPLWRDGHHPLVPPRSLKLVDGKVVFMRECQRVTENLLMVEELSDDPVNPPVFQRSPQEPDEQYQEPHRLEILLETLCWQMVYLGEDLTENADISCFSLFYNEAMSRERAEALVQNLTRATLLPNDTAWRSAAYYGEREIAFLFAYPEQTIVYAWAEDKAGDNTGDNAGDNEGDA